MKLGLPGVNTLAIDPQNSSSLYAAIYGGVFKSTDGGASWNAVNSGLPAVGIGILVVDPLNSITVYAGTGLGVFAITFASRQR